MKAKSTRRTKNIAATLPPAPAGLSFLLSQIDQCNPDAEIYAHARTIIADLHRWRSGAAGSIDGELLTRVVYPDLDPAPVVPDINTAMHAGVLLGAAVAWVLMTDLQRGAR